MSKEDLEEYSFGFNIWSYFTTACFKDFKDNEGGFYHVYRDVFEKIKTEEARCFAMREDLEEEMRKYEGFGNSTTITKKVIQFYEDWENFTTYKTFIWVD
jgi:DnaJ family protein A protein 5